MRRLHYFRVVLPLCSPVDKPTLNTLLTGPRYTVDVCRLRRMREKSCFTESCVTDVTLQCTAVIDVMGVIKTSSVNVTATLEPCHSSGRLLRRQIISVIKSFRHREKDAFSIPQLKAVSSAITPPWRTRPITDRISSHTKGLLVC